MPLTRKQAVAVHTGTLIPIVGFLALYSTMGLGITVYAELSEPGNYAIAWYLGVVSIAWLAVMFLVDAFDASLTSTSAQRNVTILTSIPCITLFVASLLSVEYYVSAPIVLFVIFKLLVGKVIRDQVCPRVGLKQYMLHTGWGNIAFTFVTLIAWIIWMHVWDKQWDDKEMFADHHADLRCNRYVHSLEYSRCKAAYLLWVSPLIVATLCFFYGIASLYLCREQGAMKMIMIQFLILGMGLWVSISISGAEMGLADDILQFGVLFCTLLVVVSVNIIGFDNLKEKISSMKIASKMTEYSQSNPAKGLIIVLCLPIMPFILLLSVGIRYTRKIGLSFATHRREEDKETKWITRYIRDSFMWLWGQETTSVFTWACYIAIFYFVCDVGVGKGAVLFLGYMISIMKELNPGVVIACFVVLGVSMFLLPPIPGPPVYLTGGVLVVGAMEDSVGFWPATVICIFVCWFTKLISCSLQQKLFGENLSGYVGVRYAVGINSIQMRAIRYCLMQPGLSIPKIAILCGGPDWPTSVLCGILGVPLKEAIIGTAPVLPLYLAYTVMAGAFTLKLSSDCAADTPAAGVNSPSPPPPPPFPPPGTAYASTGDTNYWEMASAVALGVAMISMSCTSFAAVYFMEDTIENKRKECEAFPVDEEVEAREKKVQRRKAAYKAVTSWDALPKLDKYLLGTSLFLMTLSCHIAGIFGSLCFATFSVTCSVALADVVLPLGWVAIGTFSTGCLTFYVYGKGAGRRAKKIVKAENDADMVTEIGPGGAQGGAGRGAVAAPSVAEQEPGKLPGAVTEQQAAAAAWSDDETPPGSVSSYGDYGEDEEEQEGPRDKPWERM